MKVLVGDLLVDANGVIEKPVVLIEGEEILEVGTKKSVKIPSDAEVVDASDTVLMPGMIDCHVHFYGSKEPGYARYREPFETRIIRACMREARLLLDAGFTSVMDTGGQVAMHVRNAIKERLIPGPRIMAAGRHISATAGHGDTPHMPIEWVKEGRPMGWGMEGRIADGVDECMRAVRENLRWGVDFIKICTSGGSGDHPEIPEYTIEEIKAMTHIAHSWGRRVMTHCYNPEGIRRAVLGGVDIVTHCNLADEQSIQLMNQHGTIVVPTMSVYYRMTQRRPDREPSRIAANVFDDTKRLYDSGLTLAVGTDASGPPAFGENSLELVLYVEKMGLNPLEAITIGTLNGAKAMGRTDLGTIEKGKLADIIAIEGNPLDDIKALHKAKNIKMVMKGGDVLKDTM